MGRDDANQFNHELKKLRFSDLDFNSALDEFLSVADMKIYTLPYISYLISKAHSSLAFFKYPVQIRKFIYTINLVENLNGQFERIGINFGGYFQSRQILEINVLLQFKYLLGKRWAKGVLELISKHYEILQFLKLRYEFNDDPIFQTQFY